MDNVNFIVQGKNKAFSLLHLLPNILFTSIKVPNGVKPGKDQSFP
jgi:hypothetical protein